MPKPGRKLRLLIADDHATVRRGILGILGARRSWKIVAEAGDGREAVQKAHQFQPDVVIMDVTMPNMDGLEAMLQIRETTPGSKVLVLTMHESSQMLRRVLHAGASGFVLKSDLPGELVRAIDEISQGKLFISPRVSKLVVTGFLDDPGRKPEFCLTRRELDILRILATGKSNKEIAVILGISQRTVETHRAHVMLKLCVHSVAELIHHAISNRIIPAPGRQD